MFIHIGNNQIIRSDGLLGFFDLDNTSQSKHTRAFLTRAEEEGRVKSEVTDLPKSFAVVCEKGETIVHLSQLATATLIKRAVSP